MTITAAPLSSTSSEQAPVGIVSLLLRAAEQHPTLGIFTTREDPIQDVDFVSYPDLLSEARRILGSLQARGQKAGAKIALLLERPRDFIPTFWACVLGGYVPCPLAPIWGDEDRWVTHLTHVDALLDHPLFIGSGGQTNDSPGSIALTDLKELRASTTLGYVQQPMLSDPALLMLTSGSTGNSKAVELTHANLIASLAGRAERQQLTSADVMFNWIAFDHVAALLESHMIALYVGATQLHASPVEVLADPLNFLRLIYRHRVTVAFAPNFLLGQINAALDAGPSEEKAFDLDLTLLRRIVTGGEANVVETGRRFLELLAPFGLRPDALWPAFGMTETCAASVYSHEFPGLDANFEFASVGLPIQGMQIRIVDENGATSSEGQGGELQVRGAVIFRRYYNNEEATRAAFTADGWFRTGDVGRMESGRLRLIARNKDSIIVSGVNYYSQELETKLEQLEGIERSFVAAFPTRRKGADTEQLVVTFASSLAPEDEEGLYQLVVAIRNTTIMLWGFRPALIIPMPKSAFPKTSLGKIQRSLLRKRLEAGEFHAWLADINNVTTRQIGPYYAPLGSVEGGITEVFSQILKLDASAVSATASFFDLGGTSLDILKFTRTLERRFGFKAGLPMVLQNPSVRKLAQHIALGGRQSPTKYDPIVPLQTSGRKTPLFCVHPGNGEIFALVNVAKYFLNDRPFYALRPRGFNEGEECFETVDEMIDSYVKGIQERQPEGPYAISGYSLGCEIAFEIAKVLEERGHEVAFLGAIDGAPRCQRTKLDFNMASALAWVMDLITKDQVALLSRELNAELPTDDVCRYVLTFASPERMAELDLDLRRFSVWVRVAHSMEAMLFSHAASGSVKKMTVFRGEGISPRYTATNWTTAAWRNELKRWDSFVVNPKCVDIPGHHHGLLGPRYVATSQAAFRSEIELAFGNRRSSR